MPAIRFTNPIRGAGYIQGYVQVQHNGVWGSICDDKFEDNDNGANVVCKMLGYAYGTYSAKYKQISIATRIKPKILLDNVICKGSETSIDQCAHNDWGSTIACIVRTSVSVVTEMVSLNKLTIWNLP